MLLMATIVVVSASAQVSIKSTGESRQLPYKFVDQKISPKSEAAEAWVYPYMYDMSFWGAESSTNGSNFYLDIDSMGLHEYSDGYGHSFYFSAGQTFDFTSLFYDDAGTAGQDISFRATNSLNLDTVEVWTLYFREPGYPAGANDTLLVGVYTEPEFGQTYHFNNYENSCFWGLDYDANTGLQANAQIYKVVLDEDAVSQPSETEGSYLISFIEVPVHMNNITDKAIHIAFTYKRGYPVELNDTLQSSFSLLTWKSNDPNYNLPGTSELRCYNLSHGDYVREFSDGVTDFFYPGFGMSSSNASFSCHYPRMGAKFSCSECEIVNVPEIEKNNPTVYPNPATNNFTVNLGNDEKANIQLFNIVGQQVYSETITGTAQVNVANLNSGVYMLKINQNGKVYTTKVIVK